MRSPTAAQVLDLWDGCVNATLPERAIAMLQIACPGDDICALTIAERDRRLISFRALVSGPRMDMVVRCPKCTEHLEFSIDANALIEATSDESSTSDASDTRYWGTVHESWLMRWRLPTALDLRQVARLGTAKAARRALIRRCVVAAWQIHLPSAQDTLATDVMVEYAEVSVDDLPNDALAALAEAMESTSPESEIRFEVCCNSCGEQWPADLDITSYLWTELDVLASNIVSEVHTLADAYGWHESEILAMSPRRRSAYLELLA